MFRENGPLVMEGFLLGLVPGAILGSVLVGFGAWTTKGPVPVRMSTPGSWAALVVGGSLGGIGAVIAKLVKPEQWDPIVVQRVHVTVAPMLGPRGRGLGASVSIRF